MASDGIKIRKPKEVGAVKQIALIEDQETLIAIDYKVKQLRIYSNRATVINRLDKLYQAVKEDKVDGKIYAKSYVFSTKDIGKFVRTAIFKFD